MYYYVSYTLPNDSDHDSGSLACAHIIPPSEWNDIYVSMSFMNISFCKSHNLN